LEKLGVWPADFKGEKLPGDDEFVREEVFLERWEKWLYY
jgi:hypothetical protein